MCEELISPISYSRIAKTNIDAPMENKKALINIRSARIKVKKQDNWLPLATRMTKLIIYKIRNT